MLLSLFDILPTAKPIPVVEKQNKEESFDLMVGDKQVPVKILFEARFNNRVSVNNNGVLLRISNKQTREEQKKNIDHLIKWAKVRLDKNPHLLEYLPQRKYANGEILMIGKHTFRISIFYHDQEKSVAKIFGDQLIISLTRGLTKEAEGNACSYLVTRCLCKFFTPKITERIQELNRRFFGKTVHSVKLKYNTSNWGSCSSQGNINISVRLLFAPDEVIDYVLIHELAHLVHPNHSARFWNLVEKIMPNYLDQEKHLEENNYRYFL